MALPHHISANVSQYTCISGKLRKLLSFDACATVIHNLIGSRLDYCNASILYNLADTRIGRLQRVQNQAARILARSPSIEHITPVLKQLHWLKMQERTKYNILFLAHKAFCANCTTVYLCSLVEKRESVVNTRSSQDRYLLRKPPISRDCSNIFLRLSFLYAAQYEWIANSF